MAELGALFLDVNASEKHREIAPRRGQDGEGENERAPARARAEG